LVAGKQKTGDTFPAPVLDRFQALEEIDVETIGRRSGQPRRATVWVVVADGTPFVRSEFAERGNWYQNALADPRVAIWLEGDRINAGASKVTDAEVIRSVSDAIREKYAHHGSFGSILTPEAEAATLKLAPG
jgi:deazaflavin-dependent oxidoreductase (nitroreductase family)